MSGSDRQYILVADDEEPVRRLIVRVLERHGYTLLEAANGRAALEHLARQAVDLLITDLRMPDLDGQALLDQSRTLYPDMDVILLTGYGTIQGAVYAMQRGALDYMTKPFSVAELEEHVERCFRRRAERRVVVETSSIEPLVELHRILSSRADIASVLDETIALVRRCFGPGATELAVLDEDSGTPRLIVPAGQHVGTASGVRLSVGEAERLARQDEPWLLWEEVAQQIVPLPQSAVSLTVPLVGGEQVMGTLTLMERRMGAAIRAATGSCCICSVADRTRPATCAHAPQAVGCVPRSGAGHALHRTDAVRSAGGV
jgi:CheY-like chemotaxis protein